MRQTLVEIADSAKRLRTHPFFLRLQPNPDLRTMLAFAPSGTFWVMTIQDIIVMNAELTGDPVIRRLVERHRDEDAGHEQWFLADVERIFGSEPTSIRWLFSGENRQVRTVSFALSAEVFQIRDDVLRLVFLEVLEAAAGVYFGAISGALSVAGHAGQLKYFAGKHLQSEADHEMHGAAGTAIQAIVLSPEQRALARQLSDRMFARFFQLGDAFLARFDGLPPANPSQPGQSGQPASA